MKKTNARKTSVFTEEELSALLSACAADELVAGGAYDFDIRYGDACGCIVQIAFNVPYPDTDPRLCVRNKALAKRAAAWFDAAWPRMHNRAPDNLLRLLERKGLA